MQVQQILNLHYSMEYLTNIYLILSYQLYDDMNNSINGSTITQT